MASQHKELQSIWTPANIVTCVRILFIPVYMAFALGAFTIVGISYELQAIAAFVIYMRNRHV